MFRLGLYRIGWAAWGFSVCRWPSKGALGEEGVGGVGRKWGWMWRRIWDGCLEKEEGGGTERKVQPQP